MFTRIGSGFAKKKPKFKLLISKDLIFLHIYLHDHCNCLIFSYTDFSIFGSHIHFLLWCFSRLWSEAVPFSHFLMLFPQVEAKQKSGPWGQRLAPLIGRGLSGEVCVFPDNLLFCALFLSAALRCVLGDSGRLFCPPCSSFPFIVEAPSSRADLTQLSVAHCLEVSYWLKIHRFLKMFSLRLPIFW